MTQEDVTLPSYSDLHLKLEAPKLFAFSNSFSRSLQGLDHPTVGMSKMSRISDFCSIVAPTSLRNVEIDNSCRRQRTGPLIRLA